MTTPQMILIAGPYRSGTNDNPELIEKNVQLMTEAALEVYQLGHLPVMGEWFALPLIEKAGSKQLGDEIFNAIFHPVAVQLIDFCSAVLRVGGASQGADDMIKTGREKGKIIYQTLSEIPRLT
ncbi:DUF4406 domain-containing protein [Runella sp.]|uniref:DUF4406 domain-containing protein n=1 Tax=Runella sp. TaxID=1960881 RepID=UPI003D09B4D1